MDVNSIIARTTFYYDDFSLVTSIRNPRDHTTAIQGMLGHADLSTTQSYTQVSIEKLREIHAATYPGMRDDQNKSGKL